MLTYCEFVTITFVPLVAYSDIGRVFNLDEMFIQSCML